jgi:hypothetical protein
LLGRFEKNWVTGVSLNAHASVTQEPRCLRFDACKAQRSHDVFLYEICGDATAFADHLGSALQAIRRRKPRPHRFQTGYRRHVD